MDYSINKRNPSHNDVMNNIKSKNTVIQKFGLPTKKETIAGTEVWYYSKGIRSNSSAVISPGIGNSIYGSSASNYSENYVEFHFQDDRVTHWRSRGVDYGSDNNWFYTSFGLIIDVIWLSTWALLSS